MRNLNISVVVHLRYCNIEEAAPDIAHEKPRSGTKYCPSTQGISNYFEPTAESEIGGEASSQQHVSVHQVIIGWHGSDFDMFR